MNQHTNNIIASEWTVNASQACHCEQRDRLCERSDSVIASKAPVIASAAKQSHPPRNGSPNPSSRTQRPSLQGRPVFANTAPVIASKAKQSPTPFAHATPTYVIASAAKQPHPPSHTTPTFPSLRAQRGNLNPHHHKFLYTVIASNTKQPQTQHPKMPL